HFAGALPCKYRWGLLLLRAARRCLPQGRIAGRPWACRRRGGAGGRPPARSPPCPRGVAGTAPPDVRREGGRVVGKLKAWAKIAAIALAVALVLLLGLRIYAIQQGPPLAPWHTYVPDELRAAELDQASWEQYLAHEQRLFA